MLPHYSIYLVLVFAAVWSRRGDDILYETAELVDAKQSEPESWVVPRPTASSSQQLEKGSIAGKPFLLNGRQSSYLDTKCIIDTLKERSQNAIVVDMQKLTQVCIRGIRLVSKDEDLSRWLHVERLCSSSRQVRMERKWKTCHNYKNGLEGNLIEDS